MRVVIAANTSWYIHNFRGNLIDEILALGHEVVCVAPRDKFSQHLENRGAQYVEVSMSATSMNPFREAHVCWKLLRSLRRLQPDIVFTYTPKMNLYAGFCLYFSKFRQYANISGLGDLFAKDKVSFRFLRYFMFKICFQKTEHIFFQNGEDMALIVEKKRLLNQAKCSRLPGSGVDLDRFKSCLSVVKGTEGPRVFLKYGRFLKNKGYDLYLSAAKRMKDEHGDRVEFWVMGAPDPHREDSRELYKRILTFHEMGIIRLLPWCDDIVSVLGRSDVVVSATTYNEGVPRTLLEALAAGKAIVTTNWKGARDAADDGVNGFVFEPDNEQDLCRVLDGLIKSSPKTLTSMGRAGRQKAEREFNEQIVLNRYTDLLSTRSWKRQPTAMPS
jgi:glycosyltransferase involved in cell wall biosynthesis